MKYLDGKGDSKMKTGYIGQESKTGEFSGRLTKENNAVLDMYCKANGLNKTSQLNKIVGKWAEEILTKLREN